MELEEIVEKLVGKIQPVGETNQDNERFENLKVMVSLVDDLIGKIDAVFYDNRNAHEFSIKRASGYAEQSMTETFGIVK